MKELFAEMDEWQAKHRKRLQSVSVQPDGGSFAAIALSKPIEVVIVDGASSGGAALSKMNADGLRYLCVSPNNW